MKFTLDMEAVKKSDVATRIDEPGAYIGVITLAKHVVAKTGAEGVELSFKREDGAEANYLTFWTQNAAGEKIYGFNQLNALMTCLQQRSINGVIKNIQQYNYTTRSNETVKATIYPELMNKKVGLVLDVESYVNARGEEKEKLVIKTSFDEKTKQTGLEIANKKKAEKIDKIVEQLVKKRAEKNLSQNAHQQQKQNRYMPEPIDPLELDDNLPF